MRWIMTGIVFVGLLMSPARADDVEPARGGPCLADVNGDGATDLVDLAALLAAYGLADGDPEFLAAADFDGDGTIRLTDLAYLLADYGCATSIVVNRLTFGSAGFVNVAHDCASGSCSNYATPHYLDNNSDGDAEDSGDRMYPVAYARNAYVTLSNLRFTVTPSDLTLANVPVLGLGPDGLRFEGTGALNAGVLTVASIRSDVQLPDAVACYDPFEIAWHVALSAERYQTAGVSRNRMYVTLAAPTGRRLESWFDIGTRAAEGATSAEEAIDAIWAEFADLHVEDVDGQTLGYYRGVLCASQCTVYDAQALMIYHNGQCGSWADLLMQCFNTQGITGSTMVTIEPLNTNWGLLVRSYLFSGSGTSGCSSYPFKLDSPCGGPYWSGGPECTDADGLPGQDNPNPASYFSRHFIVLMNGKFYDPSYGAGPFTGTSTQANLAWEKASIDGYHGACGAYRGARKDVNGTRETGFSY